MSLQFMREVEAGCRKFGIFSIQGFKAMKLEKITLGRRLPRWLRSKESACNAGGLGSVLGWRDPLEKDMATHSSILAWRIPWAGEPGGPQSMGSQKSWA